MTISNYFFVVGDYYYCYVGVVVGDYVIVIVVSDVLYHAMCTMIDDCGGDGMAGWCNGIVL